MKDGGNWYAYCGNDPVNRIDPSGYFASTDKKYAGISNVYGSIAKATLTYNTNKAKLKDLKPGTKAYQNAVNNMNNAHADADDARKLGDKILKNGNNARHVMLDTAGLGG